jgi:NAD(P)-dependent dehydrogenase (short-subunit alcohol dehydrogenase family)
MDDSIKSMISLDGKVAVVTGGTGNLGVSMAEALVELGAKVYIASRSLNKCIAVAELINIKYNSTLALPIELDISTSEKIKQTFEKIVDGDHKIDILVNNAHYGAGRDFKTMSDDDWGKTIDGSINAVFRCTKAVLPIMEKYSSGSIINISSMYGMVSPNPKVYDGTDFFNPANYGAGKAAIIQFTKYAACYLATDGIRVNTISPGPFPNPSVQKYEKFMTNLSSAVPMDRIGEPHELKGAIAFLASALSSYVTGVNIPVDGGWTSW